jgi:hypothetical protein
MLFDSQLKSSFQEKNMFDGSRQVFLLNKSKKGET